MRGCCCCLGSRRCAEPDGGVDEALLRGHAHLSMVRRKAPALNDSVSRLGDALHQYLKFFSAP